MSTPTKTTDTRDRRSPTRAASGTASGRCGARIGQPPTFVVSERPRPARSVACARPCQSPSRNIALSVPDDTSRSIGQVTPVRQLRAKQATHERLVDVDLVVVHPHVHRGAYLENATSRTPSPWVRPVQLTPQRRDGGRGDLALQREPALAYDGLVGRSRADERALATDRRGWCRARRSGTAGSARTRGCRRRAARHAAPVP